MAKLTIEHPLAGVMPIALPGFTATPLPIRATFDLAGDETAAPHLLPLEPNTSREADGWRALWLRPGGWLLLALSEQAVLPAGLAVPDDCRFRLTDVSHLRIGIALSGDAARTVLAKGTTLDLRPARFRSGQCARTLVAGFPVLLDVGEQAIMVYVERSLAAAFWTWLADAAAG